MTVFKWSQTAAQNDDIDNTINYQEGQSPGSLNNSGRGVMAAVAKFRDDMSGNLTTGGSGTAYTVTTNQGFTSLTDGLFVTVRFHTASGLNPTFSPDALTAKPIRLYSGVTIPTGGLPEKSTGTLAYDLSDDCWYIHGFLDVDSSFDDANFQILDNADPTKILKLQLSGITTATTRTLTVPDVSSTLLVASDIGTSVQGYDADTVKKDVQNEYTAQQGFDAQSLTDGANIAWNLDTQQVAKVTLGGNRTLSAPSNARDGGWYTLVITQDGTGSRTLSFNSAYKFPFSIAPTLSTGAADKDVLVCTSDGTNLYCRLEQDFG